MEWVSVTIESEPTSNSADFDPMFPDFRDFPRDGVFVRVCYRNVAYIFGPSLVKCSILCDDRHSKLHAVRLLILLSWLLIMTAACRSQLTLSSVDCTKTMWEMSFLDRFSGSLRSLKIKVNTLKDFLNPKANFVNQG